MQEHLIILAEFDRLLESLLWSILIILQPASTACQGLEHALRLPMGQLLRYLRLDGWEFTDSLSFWANLKHVKSPMIFVDLLGSTPLGWLRMLHWADHLVGIACPKPKEHPGRVMPVLISFPIYCRYLSLLKRAQDCTSMFKYDQTLLTCHDDIWQITYGCIMYGYHGTKLLRWPSLTCSTLQGLDQAGHWARHWANISWRTSCDVTSTGCGSLHVTDLQGETWARSPRCCILSLKQWWSRWRFASVFEDLFIACWGCGMVWLFYVSFFWLPLQG